MRCRWNSLLTLDESLAPKTGVAAHFSARLSIGGGFQMGFQLLTTGIRRDIDDRPICLEL